jgi:hypothetical protein
MSSKARGLADLGNAFKDGALSNRNLIINGAMQVAQRGTSAGPDSTNGYLTLDRWYVNSSGGTKTTSQETFASGQTDVPDFPKNYMRLAVTTGNNNLGVHQRVEDVTVLGSKTVTLSFWAKGTNPAGGSFVSSWIQAFGSGGSAVVETEAKSGIVLTSTWQKFTITFDVPSVSGKTIGVGSYTWVELLRQPATDTGTAGWTADIAQVQLEVGDTATPFEHRSYGDELARCLRYYEVFHPGSQSGYLAIGNWWTSNQARCLLQYTEKRTNPSISASDVICYQSGSGTQYALSETIDDAHSTHALLYGGVSGASTTQGHSLQMLVGANGSIQIDAEL